MPWAEPTERTSSLEKIRQISSAKKPDDFPFFLAVVPMMFRTVYLVCLLEADPAF
jgi:hypothetical protein